MSRLLLFQHATSLWAVAAEDVRGVASRQGLPARHAAIDIETSGPALMADTVLGFTEEVATLPVGAALRRLWPDPVMGLGVWQGRPLVVVDARRPPACLLRQLEP